ncbi:MAG: Quinolinate synthase A [Elusimicrobia bacterium ADurb.Bin231]|nr:MAG: Quinolinate synthase A [Elusimicrobia bacterium ADurb.Bin231]
MNLVDDIKKLKSKKKAVILAHNYQRPEIQDIADFVGDSFELSLAAANTDASIIVFCGVLFMAETAKIISPLKKVLLPDARAGCPLADMIKPEDVKKLRLEYPGAAVVCYINTSAAVKAECDICCTSSSAVSVVNSLDSDTVIFLPDRNLGRYVSGLTDKKMIIWNGYCPTHEFLSAEDIKKLKKEYPAAKFVVHPECKEEVIKLADEVTSTSGILRYAKTEKSDTFIIGTEEGILHRLGIENPGKRFIHASKYMMCQDMKYITLDSLYASLDKEETEIHIPKDISERAGATIKRMLAAAEKSG